MRHVQIHVLIQYLPVMLVNHSPWPASDCPERIPGDIEWYDAIHLERTRRRNDWYCHTEWFVPCMVKPRGILFDQNNKSKNMVSWYQEQRAARRKPKGTPEYVLNGAAPRWKIRDFSDICFSLWFFFVIFVGSRSVVDIDFPVLPFALPLIAASSSSSSS